MLTGFKRRFILHRPDTDTGGGTDGTAAPDGAPNTDAADTGNGHTDTDAKDTNTDDDASDDDDGDADESDAGDDKAGDVDELRKQLRRVNNEAKTHRLAAKAAGERATDAEKARDEAIGRAEAAEGSLNRLLAARAAGLPDDLAPRLAGDTPDELKADAERLAQHIKPAGTTNPMLAGNGAASSGDDDLAPRDRLARAYATT